mmetsp:Transcript_60194/g.140679  ORF Transcript_60194/g.140679 Transcript_60194/m.140679 type:complete len:216 (+) Transcript_60194:440-1087(+)
MAHHGLAPGHQLRRSQALLWHLLHQPRAEVRGWLGHRCGVSHTGRQHQAEGRVFLGGIERRLPVYHLVDQNAQRPPVYRQAIGFLLDDLGSHVLRGSTHRVGLPVPEVLGEAKVRELQVAGLMDQDVLRFQIPENDEHAVQVVNGRGDLCRINPRSVLAKLLLCTEKCEKLTAVDQLHGDVQAAWVLKGSQHADDERTLDTGQHVLLVDDMLRLL